MAGAPALEAGPPLLPWQGTVWRAGFRGANPLLPVTSPEGRFHHSGQTALYTSCTPEGCVVAIQRYLSPDDPPREIVPLQLAPCLVADLRGRAAVSAVWQDIRAAGAAAPTWAWSDLARAAGAAGLLYSSRSTPALTHLALFDAGLLTRAGAALPFPRR